MLFMRIVVGVAFSIINESCFNMYKKILLLLNRFQSKQLNWVLSFGIAYVLYNISCCKMPSYTQLYFVLLTPVLQFAITVK